MNILIYSRDITNPLNQTHNHLRLRSYHLSTLPFVSTFRTDLVSFNTSLPKRPKGPRAEGLRTSYRSRCRSNKTTRLKRKRLPTDQSLSRTSSSRVRGKTLNYIKESHR